MGLFALLAPEGAVVVFPLELEGIVPAHVFEPPSVLPALRPEQRLVLAVLVDAVKTFRTCATASGTCARRQRAELERWFGSEEAGDSPFTFENVCAALGLEASYVRRRLRSWPGPPLAAGGTLARRSGIRRAA